MSDTPNIVLVTLHDLGAHLDCYDPDLPATPNITRVGDEGVVFESHFSTCPLCSPARSSIQTGRHPHTNGLDGLTHRGFKMHADEKCISHYLNDAGYHTALYGMQHETEGDPAELGYAEICAKPEYSSLCPEIMPHAVAFLKRGHDKPFFLSIGLTEVHRAFKREYSTPVPIDQVKVPPYLPDCPDVREDLADFYGLIQVVDRGMKLLLDALDETGLTENTLVIFTCDHGFAFPRAKSTLYDPGIHVTLLMRWPGGVAAGSRISGLTSHVDVLPTLLDIVGVAKPDRVIGRSFLPLLGDAAGSIRDHVFSEKSWHGNEYDPMRCIRTDRYKYIRNFTEGWLYQSPLDIKRSLSGKAVEASRQKPRPEVELYDLESDPDEFDNLAGRPEVAEIQAELDAKLLQFMKDTGDPLPDDHIPWPQPDKACFLTNKDMPPVDE